ncbi:hypothetical protein BDV18DRAFT_154302 [Aspergillus unguis]
MSRTISLLTLPLELRQGIYKLILGDKIIIFVHDEDAALKLSHCVCPTPGKNCHWLLADDKTMWCNSHTNWNDREDATRRRLPLLLTCRQIYFEAVDILWSHNAVHLALMDNEDFDILANLQAVVSPRIFQTIRMLEISFLHPRMSRLHQELDEDWFRGWAGFWTLVKSMKGLVHVRAWIKMIQRGLRNIVTAEQEIRLFAPLMDMQIPDFSVEVTWPANEGSERLLSEAPFCLTRNVLAVLSNPNCGNDVVDRQPT